MHRLHIEFGEQADQLGVGPFVEHEKPSVNTGSDQTLIARERHIDRVGVSTKIVSCFKKGDFSLARAWAAARPEMPEPTMATLIDTHTP